MGWGHRAWWVAGVVGLLAAGCGSDSRPPNQEEPQPLSPGEALPPGTEPPPVDLFPPLEPPPEEEVTQGPWPLDAVVNYSAAYGIPPVQSVGVDDAYNLWFLNGAQIGVLRAGQSEVQWTEGVGQAAGGFGLEQKALGSTVICGGAAGKAYVGYAAAELEADPGSGQGGPAYVVGPGQTQGFFGASDPVTYNPQRFEVDMLKGDLDAVQLQPDGSVVLEEHIGRSVGQGYPDRGIHNTNDWHFDEDRTVRVCRKVLRGPFRGELYIGTNHGVTRIRGLYYNSHLHPVWFQTVYDSNGNPRQTQRAGETYAVGIGKDGQLLIANDWTLGIHEPKEDLRDFDNESPSPFVFDGFVDAVGGVEDKDFWRGFEQTSNGDYFLGSKDKGLWKMKPRTRHEADYTRITGPGMSASILALAATEDGSLFIGTNALYRLAPGQEVAEQVSAVPTGVKQLLYDPTVQPSMLYVLSTGGQLTVLRGY